MSWLAREKIGDGATTHWGCVYEPDRHEEFVLQLPILDLVKPEQAFFN
jgi:hypothetical protein